MKSKLFEHLTFISLSYALALIFSGAVMLLPQQALSEESAQGIEEVVVTARRREEISQEVPIPISALSAAYLEDRGITEIQRIEQVTPNLSFTNSSVSRNTAQVFLRGIGQVNWGPTQDPKVGTYIDGVYLGRPQGGVFDLFDIERVEVLRGPQGTLFGRNTTAGLVQVITRNPSDELEAKVRVGTGNAGQVTTDALLNIPLIEGVLAGRVSMQTRRDDGFMKDRSGRKWNETDSKSARAKLLWTPTDTFEAMLTAEYYGARETAGLGKCIGATGSGTGLDFIASIAGRQDDLVRACTPVNDYYLSNDNDPNHADIDTRQITLDMSWDMGWGTLNSLTASRTMDAMSQSWGWGTDFVGEPSNSIDVLEYVRNPYDQVSQEFRIESEAFDDRLTWTVGMYWFYESATQIISAPMWRGIDTNPSAADAPMWGWDYSMLDPSVPPGFMTVGDLFLATQAGASRDQETHATQTSYAAFAEATYEINDEWSVTAGYRYTKDTRKFRRYQFTVGGGFDAENFCPGMPLDANGAATMAYCDQELRYGQATPRLIVNYKFTDDIMVFASFARGYSSGGMNGDIRMRPFEPEISDNWEIGMKSQWMDNQLRLNMNVFQTDYENQQITVSRMQRGQPTADLINAQKATMQGIEMELQATPIEGLRLTASFGYLDGEYDKFSTMDSEWDPVTLEETEFVNDFSHIDFVGGAPYNWSIHAAYEIPMDNGGMVTIGGGWSHRGREYNTLRRFHTSRQDAYGLLDAQIVWDLANNKTSVTIWGTNLNGKEYFRGALDVPSQTLIDGSPTDKYGEPVGQDLGVTIIYPAEPRRYGITLTHNLTN